MYRVVSYWNGERNINDPVYSDFESACDRVKLITDRILEQYQEVGATLKQGSSSRCSVIGVSGNKEVVVVALTQGSLDGTDPERDFGMLIAPDILNRIPDSITTALEPDLPYGSQRYFAIGVHTLVATKSRRFWHVHLRNHLELYAIDGDILTALGKWLALHGLELEKLQRSEEPEIFR